MFFFLLLFRRASSNLRDSFTVVFAQNSSISTEQCTSPSKSHKAVPFRRHFFFTLRMHTNHYGRGSKPCSLWEEDSLADSVLNHVFARHGDEMGLVGACNGDWVMEHLKELDINFLAKFCNVFHTFWARVLLMYCVKSMIVLYYLVLLVGFLDEPLNLFCTSLPRNTTRCKYSLSPELVIPQPSRQSLAAIL